MTADRCTCNNTTAKLQFHYLSGDLPATALSLASAVPGPSWWPGSRSRSGPRAACSRSRPSSWATNSWWGPWSSPHITTPTSTSMLLHLTKSKPILISSPPTRTQPIFSLGWPPSIFIIFKGWLQIPIHGISYTISKCISNLLSEKSFHLIHVLFLYTGETPLNIFFQRRGPIFCCICWTRGLRTIARDRLLLGRTSSRT